MPRGPLKTRALRGGGDHQKIAHSSPRISTHLPKM
jgi:hypothetical protein